MKVLQINTVCGVGSTGRTATELADALEKNGHECHIAFGQGTTSFVNSYKIGTRIENHLHNAGSRVLGKQGYFSVSGTEKLVHYISTLNPDIIHLRNLHGNYVNLEILFTYLAGAGKPVIWSLHDCWAYTGKCAHYTDVACYKWKTQCHHCPQVHQYPPSYFFDHSADMYIDKKKWFTSIKNMTIVPVSNWLANEAKQSFLNKYPVVPIYNWVDHSIFKPVAGSTRAKYNIDPNTFVILGVSAAWSRSDSKLTDFIQLADIISPGMQVVLVGGAKNAAIPKNIRHIPYVGSTHELAAVYSMADVYVHTSTQDTFGKVIAEAMSCGTPAIVYNSTACPELVAGGCGYVVEKRDAQGICNAVANIKNNGKNFYSEKCIAHVQQHFDFYKNSMQVINLYKSAISNAD